MIDKDGNFIDKEYWAVMEKNIAAAYKAMGRDPNVTTALEDSIKFEKKEYTEEENRLFKERIDELSRRLDRISSKYDK